MPDFEQVVIAGGVSFVFIGVLAFLFDLQASAGQFVLLFGAFVLLAAFAQRTGDISVGFTIMTIALLFVVSEYIIPSPYQEIIVDPIAFSIGAIAGVFGVDLSPLADIDSLSFLVIATVFVGLMHAARIRLTGEARFPRPIFENVLAQFLRYADTYLNVARLVLISIAALVIIALQQAGLFFGGIGDVAAEAPFVLSNIVIGLSGYLSLGGELPVIVTVPLFGDLDAAGFAVLVIVVMGTAAMAYFRPSGAVGQFIRRIV